MRWPIQVRMASVNQFRVMVVQVQARARSQVQATADVQAGGAGGAGGAEVQPPPMRSAPQWKS